MSLVTPKCDFGHRLLPREKRRMRPVGGKCWPERKANETHWHAIDRTRSDPPDLLSALGKPQVAERRPTPEAPPTQAAVQSKPRRKSALVFGRAGPTGPEGLRVRPLPSFLSHSLSYVPTTENAFCALGSRRRLAGAFSCALPFPAATHPPRELRHPRDARRGPE